MAILAAIVASQALITSTFQLLSQVMHSSYFPHVQMIYTSDKFHGQVYIPVANWLLMIGTILVTAVYNNVSCLEISQDQSELMMKCRQRASVMRTASA